MSPHARSSHAGPSTSSWSSLGVCPSIVKALQLRGFQSPTPIQRSTLPLTLGKAPRDILGMARTGSGKTLAFVIPLLQYLSGNTQSNRRRALVLVPTRELALQSLRVAKDLGRGLRVGQGEERRRITWALIMGGEQMDEQFRSLEQVPDVCAGRLILTNISIIATPGRFLHLTVEMNYDLKDVGLVVFDEADRLFEMGFSLQLLEIIARLPLDRHSMLFSATLPTTVAEFVRAGLSNPSLVRLDSEYRINPDLSTSAFRVSKAEKEAALISILEDIIRVPVSPDDREKAVQVIIFVATKHHVDFIVNLLSAIGYSVNFVYGNLDQIARQQQLRAFINRQSSILVVTDVAARGLDIPDIDNVVNYDFPANSRAFVHRVGRAGRSGRSGTAWSLVTREDLPYYHDLNQFLSSSGQQQPLHTLSRADIDEKIELVDTLLGSVVGLQEMRDVMKRGDSLYLRSRPGPSPAAMKAAKTSTGQLPEFPRRSEDATHERDSHTSALLQSLLTFRPLQPVATLSVPQRLKKRLPNREAADAKPDDDLVCGANRSASSKSFRDCAFYMSSSAATNSAEKGYSIHEADVPSAIRATVHDVIKDDTGPQRAQRASQLKWGRRTARTSNGSTAHRLMIKTENGSALPATYASGKYREYVKRRAGKGGRPQPLVCNEYVSPHSGFSSWM